MKWIIQTFYLVACIAVVYQCGGNEFDPKSLLNSYRVIAVQASPPSIGITEFTKTIQIKLWDYHPNDIKMGQDRPKTQYEWSLCLFSVGALRNYECLVDEIPLESATDLTEFELSPIMLFLQAQMDGLLDGLDMGEGDMNDDMMMEESELSTIDIYLKLTITVAGETPQQTVKKLTVHFDDRVPQNNNPTIDGIEFAVNEMPIVAESEINLKALIDAQSTETYLAIDPTSNEGEEREEELILAWFSTTGTFEPAVSLLMDPKSVLKIPEKEEEETLGTNRIFLTVRDGRGGVDVQFIDFNVEASE